MLSSKDGPPGCAPVSRLEHTSAEVNSRVQGARVRGVERERYHKHVDQAGIDLLPVRTPVGRPEYPSAIGPCVDRARPRGVNDQRSYGKTFDVGGQAGVG